MSEDIVKDCSVSEGAACTRGHFPGRPLVPGAFLLARVAELLAEQWPDRRLVEVRKVKFIKPLEPGSRAEMRCRLERDTRVRFSITDAKGVVLEGSGSLALV